MKKIAQKFVSILAALSIIVPFGFSPVKALAADTGFLSPAADSANGFADTWSNASGAYANGGGSATESDGDRHHYYTFNFSIPAGSTVDGIEVRADAWSTDPSGCSFGVDLSWNGGSNWSSQKTTALNGSETTYVFGGPTDDWGSHSWILGDFTNGNFRVRVDSIAPFNCTGTRHLDWIRTKVYYTEPIETEIVAFQLTSATPTNTTIAELTENFEINLDTHGTNLTIVAETNPATVGSVRFNLDAGAHQKTENIFPYSIMGDLPAGDFDPMPLELLPLGLHSVTATPYSEADMGGVAGDPFTVNFKVIQNEAGRCSDETDNDLDGLTDLTDPDCAPTQGTLTIVKEAVGGSGSFDFVVYEGEAEVLGSNIAASEGENGSTAALPVDPGTYSISEQYEEGWVLTDRFCMNGETPVGTADEGGMYDVLIGAGDDVVCTFQNTFAPEFPTVTIYKFIDGVLIGEGSEVETAFPMTASWDTENIGADTGFFPLSSENDFTAMSPAMSSGSTYSVSEITDGDVVGTACDQGKPYALYGYTVGNSYAQAAAAEPNDSTPTFENLIFNKYVIVWNDDCNTEVGGGGGGGGGGEEGTADLMISKYTTNSYGEFTFRVSGLGIAEESEEFSLSTGWPMVPDSESFDISPAEDGSLYYVTEEALSGWDLDAIECDFGDEEVISIESGGSISIKPGDSVICRIYNTATTGFVEVVKEVINDDGENSEAEDFTIGVIQSGDLLDSFPGSESGTVASVPAGAYLVLEEDAEGYMATYSENCNSEIAVGEYKTCVVTNDDYIFDGTTSGSEANPTGSVLGAFTDNSDSSTGQVLGASCPLPSFEQLIGIRNGVGADPVVVKAVQEWLNSSQNAGLTVTGIYDEPTKFAVMLFQEKYSDTLSPWGIAKATGHIWLTTANQMLIVAGCGGYNLPSDSLFPFAL